MNKKSLILKGGEEVGDRGGVCTDKHSPNPQMQQTFPLGPVPFISISMNS